MPHFSLVFSQLFVTFYLQKHLPVKAAREAGTNYIVETTDGTQDHVTGAIDETKEAYIMQ